MRCGTLLNRLLPFYAPPKGELYGWLVAETELIKSTLANSNAVRWDFWGHGLTLALPEVSSPMISPANLDGLQQRYPNRVSAETFNNLKRITQAQPYTFVTNAPSFSQVSEIRDQLGCESVPICGLVHSVLAPDLFPMYGWLSLTVQPHDVIVASSRAGKIAIENIFDSVRDRIAGRVGLDSQTLPSPRIVEIPFGTTVPDDCALDREHALRVLDIPSDCFVIMYLGRISEEFKADLDPLLQAVSQLTKDNYKVRLILAGQLTDHAYRIHLQRRLQYLQIQPETVLLENFPEFIKTSLFAACQVVVSPVDSIQETFGLAVLEAMAHSRPVIASSWSGYRDLVIDNVTGFLLKTTICADSLLSVSAVAATMHPREASYYLAQRTVIDVEQLVAKLTVLIHSPSLGEDMGRAGRQRVIDHFSWSQVAGRFIDLWKEQNELAKQVAEKRSKAAGLNQFFAHYADGIIAPDDRIRAIKDNHGVLQNLSAQWKFRDQNHLRSLKSIMELCAEREVTMHELNGRGYSTECVLWLAKKGLCSITNSNIQL